MRVPGLIVVILLAFASAVHAQPATQDSAAARPCGEEEPCPPAPPAPVTSASSFADRLDLTIGLGIAGDAFPYSSVKAPGSTLGQRSLMGGARFWLGVRLPDWLALRGVFEMGYISVGTFPGRGSDALFEGAGLEVSLEYFARLKPFVRFMYDAVVVPIAAIGSATHDPLLADYAYFFQVGARLSIVELHLSLGRDFAGGLAPGIGFSVYWLH